MVFRKYEKTYRILVPQISTQGKHYLSDADTANLLNGNITITEKLDGANVGIIRRKDNFRLQKRGSLVDVGEHYQFNYFKAWSTMNHDKIMQIPKDTILYGELMICKHTVFYDMLPDYFLAFAWVDCSTGEYYHWDDMQELCEKIGLHTVPLLAKTSVLSRDNLFDYIPNPSTYGHEQAEGIVVWNYKKNMRGKVVLRKFQESMDMTGHWASKQVTQNVLRDKDKDNG